MLAEVATPSPFPSTRASGFFGFQTEQSGLIQYKMARTPRPERSARGFHLYAPLKGAEMEMLRLVFNTATAKQWAEWLRVPLEHAAASGNHDLFTKLMQAGAKCGAGWVGCNGRTLLYAAAQGGNADVMSAVLPGGCRSDIGVFSDHSYTRKRSPLYAAAEAGHEAAARHLVLAGADVNYVDPSHGCVALVVAIEDGQGDLTRDLLIAGASLDDWKDPVHGRSRLHVAAEKGHDKVVSALVCTSLDINAADNDSITPLMLACGNGHVATAKALLIAGAHVESSGKDGRSPIDFAVQKGHKDVLKAVLEFGVSVPDLRERDDEVGGGILRDALFSGVRYDQADIVEILLDAGANIEFIFLRDDYYGWTPLLVAAATGSTKAMLVLLQKGALVDKVDDAEDSALHLACINQKKLFDATIDVLLRWGVSETAENSNSETAAVVLEDNAGDGECSDAELERARLLLARAPEDRAWRRRCWLVMLRLRIDRARQLASDTSGQKQDDGSDKQLSSLSDAKADQISGRTVSSDHDAGGSTRNHEPNEGSPDGDSVTTAGVVNAGVSEEGRGWSGLVTVVVDRTPDPVFRKVVLFL